MPTQSEAEEAGFTTKVVNGVLYIQDEDGQWYSAQSVVTGQKSVGPKGRGRRDIFSTGWTKHKESDIQEYANYETLLRTQLADFTARYNSLRSEADERLKAYDETYNKVISDANARIADLNIELSQLNGVIRSLTDIMIELQPTTKHLSLIHI